MPTGVALALLTLVLTGLAGCRSATPIVWPPTPAPTLRPDVVDGRGRFREVFCAVRDARAREAPVRDDRPCAEALVQFADEPPATGAPVVTTPSATRRRFIVVNGIFGECMAPWITPFGDSVSKLEALGYRGALLRVSGTAASGTNAQQVRDYVLSLPDLAPDERVILVGYSKGAVDALEALVAFPELVPRVAALVSLASPITGSPIADGFGAWQRAIIETLASPFCGGGRGAITSITRETRRAFMARVRLPATVRYFSLVAVAQEMEVSRPLLSPYRDLAVVDPRNDGQVVLEDGIMPGAELLGYLRGDHWAVALPFSRTTGPLGWLARQVVDRNPYPREILLEAIVRLVEERL
jgi:pimeloyl-ACP methyl ester carboxylesterase